MIITHPDDVTAVEVQDEIVMKGPVSRKILVNDKDTAGFGVALVTFGPGARLNLHAHKFEQILYVTEGKGIIATRFRQYTVTPGTVVYIPPGEIHWHGATEDSSFSHIAIQKPGIKLVQ
ncbi:MAG: cupin domain-containing protein [Dehalococcoidales bacterium]|nr:cupin domain-containing protein [Dehalococcoidales bacterium]